MKIWVLAVVAALGMGVAGVGVAQTTQTKTSASKPAMSAEKLAEKKKRDFDAMVKKVEGALPKEATAKPAKPRKLLVASMTMGFRHSSIEIGGKAVALIGEKTGAYEVTATEDPAAFEAENLAKFDAVLLLNTTGEIFTAGKKGEPAVDAATAERRKKAFLDFVASGKGVAGIHAATDCNYKWADYGALIGGYFDGHPWHEKLVVKNVEPDHPVNAAFEGKNVELADELYQIKAPYSRTKQRELLALQSTEKDAELKKGKRADKDYPVAWVKTYGEGRVFYCSLGHREEIFWNPAMLKHYLAGIQFVLGDLRAEASPSEKASAAEVLERLAGR